MAGGAKERGGRKTGKGRKGGGNWSPVGPTLWSKFTPFNVLLESN